MDLSPTDYLATGMLNAGTAAQLGLNCVWGIEERHADGWRALRARTGALATFEDYDQAVARSVAHWRRTDRPARPLQLASL